MKKIVNNTFSLIFASVLVTSCATQAPVARTPSGRPEVTIQTQDVEAIKAVLVDSMTRAGFNVQEDTKYRLAFTKQMDGAAGVLSQALIGNEYSTTPISEISFNLAAIGNQVRISAQMGISTQMALGQTRRQDMSRQGKWFNDIQRLLLNVKQGSEIKTHEATLKDMNDTYKGKIGINFDGAGVLFQIEPNSPASRAGLLIEDRILQVNGQPLADNIVEKFKQLAGQPGSKVSLVVQRKLKKLPFELVRE